MAMALSDPADRPAERPGRMRMLLRRVARSWLFLAFFVGFFLFWEHSIDWFGIPAYILPKPSEIIVKSSADLHRLVYYTYVTGLETIIGYAVAIVLAVPLGLAIAFSSILRRTIYPFFVSIEMVPKIAGLLRMKRTPANTSSAVESSFASSCLVVRMKPVRTAPASQNTTMTK